MGAKNVAKNSFFSVFSQVMIILAGFFSQRVINIKLGTELVGLNGVISNVLMVFSVTELGISTAIVFHLYQAIHAGDEKGIAALMNLYRKAYAVVAGIMAVLGLAFLPFIHCFLRENHFTPGYVRFIYGLWLIRAVLGYLLSYKRSIVIADQKEYVTSLATLAVSIVNYVSVIIFVLLFEDYALALVIGIVFETVMSVWLIFYVDRHYPYLKRYGKERLDKGKFRRIITDVRNLFITRVAQKILGSTDNLIMSVFISLSTVGYYSNYCLITQSLINVMQAFANALAPTMGNLVVENNRERDEDLLQCSTFVFFLLASIIMSGVAGVASIFVSDVWLDETFVLPKETVWFCAFNCMLYVLFLPIGVFTSVSGLFWQEKWVSLSAAMVNLVLSLALVKKLGIMGVLVGTTFAYFILFLGKTLFYYHHYLRKEIWGYVGRMGSYLLLTVVEAILSQKAVELIYVDAGFFRFILAGMSCVFIPVVCNLLLFARGRLTRQTIVFIKNYKRNSRRELGEGS